MKITSTLARALLRLFGWRVLDLPELPAKAVVICYPHTSNWDFLLGIVGLHALGMTPRWAGKDSLFVGWSGPLMRALGGIPVNRREHTGFVARMAEELAKADRMLLCMAPEGTRRLSAGWKSGFYRIALAAQVPVVAGVVDYSRRELGLVDIVALSGDEAADMARLAAVYAGRQGHKPANASPIRLIK